MTLRVQEREGGTERKMNRKEGEKERKWGMEKRRAKIGIVNFV